MYREEQDSNGRKKKVYLQKIRYEIQAEIGSGTFGKVFKSLDLETGEIVAIKQAFQDKKYKNRQFDVLSTLNHENIVSLKDHYYLNKSQDKYLYIVMGVYNSNLYSLFKEYRKEKKKFLDIEIKIMGFQLFKALMYLRFKKVCHRDLKPPNILLQKQTLELRLCDFGSSKIFNQVQKNVTYICSRYYRAPELIFEYGLYGTQIDVWSAGCILVQFLTKEPIFPGDSALEQLIQIVKALGIPDKKYLQKINTDDNRELATFPEIPFVSWEILLRKYKPNPLFVDLISQILVYDTEKRLTPIQVLKHPYFHELTLPQNRPLTDKLPKLFHFQIQGLKYQPKQLKQLKEIYQSRLNLYKLKSRKQDEMGKIQTCETNASPNIQVPHREDKYNNLEQFKNGKKSELILEQQN